MRRAFSLVGLFLIALTAAPRSAEADIWDWLQEFSGPGPFHTRNLNLMVPCTNEVGVRSEALPQVDPSNPKPCWYIDYRSFKNNTDQDNFKAGKVELHVFEVGGSVRLHRAIDVGFGGGAMFFNTEKGGKFVRGVLTVPRVQITPAMLFGSSGFWSGHQSRGKTLLKSVKYYLKENIVLGPLDAERFGLSASQSNFKVTNDRVFSCGFIIDFNEAVRFVSGR